MKKDEVNRIVWVDLLKGVAILWLIVYHLYIFDWLRSPVPVFFFLSGLFFSDRDRFVVFLNKKAKALLVPFVFFFILGILASFGSAKISGKPFVFPPVWKFFALIPVDAEVQNPLGVGAIWFLISLFELYVVYYLLRKITQNKWWLFGITMLLWLASVFLMERYAKGSFFYFFYSLSFLPFFVVAHLFREKIIKQQIPWWIIAVAVVFYISTFFPQNDVLSLSIWSDVLLNMRDLISSLGLVVLLVFFFEKLSSVRMLSESKIAEFICFEGRNSMTILGVHLLAKSVVIVLLERFMVKNGLFYLALFFIIAIISNICIFLFNRFVPSLVNHKK